MAPSRSRAFGLRRQVAFGLVAIAPSAVDVALLVVGREVFGLPLLVADAGAILVASVVSYLLHRVSLSRTNPYARWTQSPLGFALVALVAAAVDVAVLRLTFTATGFTTVGGLLAAKMVSLPPAALTRILGYRLILADLVRENNVPARRPLPDTGPRLSVVIPAFREPDRIRDTVGQVRSELADVTDHGGLEIIVVDDGSGDDTSVVARAAGADEVVTLPENRGKGAAVRAGMAVTRGRTVCFTDADLAYHPSHLRDLLTTVEAGWDVAIGDRRHPDSRVARASTFRSLGSRLVNALSAAVLLDRPLDTQCGLKAFHGEVGRRAFAACRIDGFAFDIEVLHLVERAAWSLCKIPVELDETDAPSTVRVVRDLLRLTRDLVRIRRLASSGAYDVLTGGTVTTT